MKPNEPAATPNINNSAAFNNSNNKSAFSSKNGCMSPVNLKNATPETFGMSPILISPIRKESKNN